MKPSFDIKSTPHINKLMIYTIIFKFMIGFKINSRNGIKNRLNLLKTIYYFLYILI